MRKRRVTGKNKSGPKLLIILIVIAVAVFFMTTGRDLITILRLRGIIHQNERIIEENTSHHEELTREIDLLQSDSTYIEHIAREELGMIRTGEEVFTLPPDSTSAHKQ